MTNYLNLLVFPSKAIEKLDKEKSQDLTYYLIFSTAFLILLIPKFFAIHLSDPKAYGQLIGLIISIPATYYLISYSVGYIFWILAKGFKGTSTFVQMRLLVGYSLLPLILKAVVFLPFILVGLINKNGEISTPDNSITNLVFWLIGFRILMVGIAKFNKFNWTITIVIWFIIVSSLGVLAYFLKMLNH